MLGLKITIKVYGIGFLIERTGLVRYFMQIKGNFDLTVASLEVIIPTTLKEIVWPRVSYDKANFSLF